MSVRSFIALPVPEPIAAELGDAAARLASQDKEGRVRWVEEENYHVTLAFLGEIDEPVMDDLAMELDNALADFGETEILVTSIALFPFGKRPRLIAAMVEASENIRLLHSRTVRAARSMSIPLDRRRFYPHITLGRLRRGGRRNPDFPPTSIALRGTANVVKIYESTLTPDGSVYDPLYEIQLDLSASREFG